MSYFAFFFPQSILQASEYYLIQNFFYYIITAQFGEFIVPIFIFCILLFRSEKKEEEESTYHLLTSEEEPLPAPHEPLPIYQCADDAVPDFSVYDDPLPVPLPAPLPYFPSETSGSPTSDKSGIPIVIVSKDVGTPDDQVNVAMNEESSTTHSPVEPIVTVAQEAGDNQVVESNHVADQPATVDIQSSTDNNSTSSPNTTHTATPINNTTTPTDNNQLLCFICKKNPATMRINPCEEEICSSCAPTGGRCPSCGAPILTIESIRNCPVCLEYTSTRSLQSDSPLYSPIHDKCRNHDYLAANSHRACRRIEPWKGWQLCFTLKEGETQLGRRTEIDCQIHPIPAFGEFHGIHLCVFSIITLLVCVH